MQLTSYKTDIRTNFLLFIIALVLIGIIYSCNAHPSQKEEKISKKSKSTTKSVNQDSLIDFPCAVLVYPSSQTIALLKKTGSDNDFYTAADDNQYYMSQCIDYLDSVKTKKITRESKGVASFKAITGKTYKIQLDSLYWGVLLFNGKSKPIEADITMIQDDYNSYMKK
jgi:hypothetical protein